jgi:hypothetical protein
MSRSLGNLVQEGPIFFVFIEDVDIQPVAEKKHNINGDRFVSRVECLF